MRQFSRLAGLVPFVLIVPLLTATGCQTNEAAVDEVQVERYEERMAAEEPFAPVPELTQVTATPPAELTGDAPATSLTLDTLAWLQVPDPSLAKSAMDQRLANSRMSQSVEQEYKQSIYPDTQDYVKQIERARKVDLSLTDAISRALANNYQIIVDGYAPAISTAQVVQAEAAFDVAVFANVNRNNTDRPTAVALAASQTDTTTVSGGIRKLLATGAQMTLTQALVRVDNPGFQFNILNPSYSSTFVAELRQPILRNFGIDLNRSQINIRKSEQKINEEAFRATVIDVVNQTEQAYWNLVAARRDVTISAELMAQAELTYKQIEARKDYDAYQTLLFRSKANLEQRKFEYISVRNRVRDAEDQLTNFLNDPDFPLTDDYEIIPIDNPLTSEILFDRFHAVQTALERRPEILQARYGVDIARLSLGIAKNQALPQLDVIYRATFSGLKSSADRSFDQMTGGNFVDQFIGMEFLWNFGERAERAGIRIAALQQSQSVARYKQAIDNIITDCRVTMRALETSYEQIGPTYEAVIAAAENLRSLQERQENKSPPQLETILVSQENLAQARRGLLSALVRYNQGIVDVERAKGTLLEYNNIVLDERP